MRLFEGFYIGEQQALEVLSADGKAVRSERPMLVRSEWDDAKKDATDRPNIEMPDQASQTGPPNSAPASQHEVAGE